MSIFEHFFACDLALWFLFSLLAMAVDGDIINTDLLIVGAGPAGASLACFLAEHGKDAHRPFQLC